MPQPGNHDKTLRKSQINLRTILVLFFCLAVGLTIGIHPPAQSDAQPNTWTTSTLPTGWFYILLGTGSTEMVLGLVQHVRLLFIDLCAANEPRAPSGSPDLASKMLAAGFICRATMNNWDANESKEYRFALSFAILWRAMIALLIVTCLVGVILNRRTGLRFS